jgi:hypothetical protein
MLGAQKKKSWGFRPQLFESFQSNFYDADRGFDQAGVQPCFLLR